MNGEMKDRTLATLGGKTYGNLKEDLIEVHELLERLFNEEVIAAVGARINEVLLYLKIIDSKATGTREEALSIMSFEDLEAIIAYLSIITREQRKKVREAGVSGSLNLETSLMQCTESYLERQISEAGEQR